MANIFLYDEYGPEDTAMMQALYSRSPESVEYHVEKVKKTGSGKFMERFYVGYGHASIADCGSTTLFIEKISILGAKAIQDWPLYSGQETSTRYIDMSKQPMVDPVGTEASAAIQKKWLDFYVASGPAVIEHLREKYPRKPEEEEKMYEKAIKARSFDILRGFLPAGITTQLSWHTNLRQAWDKLALLRYHPLAEIRAAAKGMISALKRQYPNSFSHREYEEQEAYRKRIMEEAAYFAPDKFPDELSVTTTVTKDAVAAQKELLSTRPQKTTLPFFLRDLGTFTFDFLLDFGSFRDAQRHRASIHQMPLLTTKFGFHPWYLDQLPDAVRKEADALLETQKKSISELDATDEDRQYYIGMGYQVPCRFTFDLPGLVYFAELRSGRLVHPTLRPIAQQMGDEIASRFPDIALHIDHDQDDWDARRGLQDIAERKEE